MLPIHKSKFCGFGPSLGMHRVNCTFGAFTKVSPAADPVRHSPATRATQYLRLSAAVSPMTLPGPLMSVKARPPDTASVGSCFRASAAEGCSVEGLNLYN